MSAFMSARLFRQPDWEKVAVEAGFQPKQMAALCGISLRHLERYFANAFQQTPTVWIRDLRCRLAMGLIGQGYSNKEVVTKLKFGSSSHFCHDFRKSYARSPRKTAESLFGGQNVANGQQMSVLDNTSLLQPRGFSVGMKTQPQAHK